jgi:hypothetical protein
MADGTGPLGWVRRRLGGRGGGGEPLPEPVDQVGRAAVTYAAIERAFAGRGGVLHRETVPRSHGGYCYLWPFSRLAAAALDLVELGALGPEDADRLLDGLDAYWRGDGRPPGYDSAVRPPRGPGGDRFYDDNAWVGLDLVRQHRVTGRPGALGRARAVLAFLASGWDDDPGHPSPGGVFWVESPTNRDRNTVSTAPAARLGFLLSALDGDTSAATWAERALAWVHRTLRDPSDGLYWDHLALDGSIERTKWSYNQGNVIGAELARWTLATSDGGTALGGRDVADEALARAEEVARAALDHFAGSASGLAGQGHPFNAIFLRHLLELRSVTADPGLSARVAATVVAHADDVWRSQRGPDGLFRPPGSRTATLVDQAAVVEIQALAARVAGAPPPPSPGPSASG